MPAPSPAPTVHVVGPNPALDRLQVVADLRLGEVHRASRVVSRAGGKGMIVARGVVRLGGRAALHGFLGGPTGHQIAQGCRELGIADHHVSVPGDTRLTTVVVDAGSGLSTVVNEPGPPVTPADAERLVAGVLASVSADDLVVCTGSLPPGCPVELYAELSAALGPRGVRVVVDTSGAALAAAVRARPWLVKVNEHELVYDAGLAGAELNDSGLADEAGLAGADGSLDVLMAEALGLGVEAIVVTRGAAGLCYRSPSRRLDVTSPPVTVVNATGSGDLVLAGLASALLAGATLGDALRRGTAAGAAGAARLEPDLTGLAEVEQLAKHATVVERPTEPASGRA